jgi:hypothetical protein
MKGMYFSKKILQLLIFKNYLKCAFMKGRSNEYEYPSKGYFIFIGLLSNESKCKNNILECVFYKYNTLFFNL